jgi:hypothetical protein
MKLSKLQMEQPQPCAACLKRYLPSAGTSSTRHLSNVVYALCQAPQVIRRQHQAALQQLVPAFMEKRADANAQDISNVLYGMADSGQQWPEEAVQQLLSVFVSQLHQVKPQNVSNSLWAVAKLGQQVPSAQLQQLLIALVNQLHQAKPQNLSNALWAVAWDNRCLQGSCSSCWMHLWLSCSRQIRRTWLIRCGQWQPWGKWCHQDGCSSC